MLKKNKKTQSVGQQREPFYEALVDKVALLYVDGLPEKRYPREEEMRSASGLVENRIKETLEEEWTAGSDLNMLAEDRAAMRLNFGRWITEFPLRIPKPPLVAELSGWKLAIAAVIGCILGALIISGLFNLLMDEPRIGMMIGGPLGAAAVIVALFYAADNPKIRYTLQALLGAATVAELWIGFSAIGLGGVWTALTGMAGVGVLGMMRRIGLYIAVIFFLKLGVRSPVYDREEYRKLSQPFIDLWLRSADMYFQLAFLKLEKPSEQHVEQAGDLDELGFYLHKLHQCSLDVLPEVAAELLVRARNLGVEGLTKAPLFLSGEALEMEEFIWDESAAQKYNALGALEKGDRVFVAEQAVVRDGRVIEKGLVRKVRKR
ncbi:MAG: hypothetical protein ACRBF0_19020 [Calditrichia bacterium]